MEHSKLFVPIKMLYSHGLISPSGLKAAVEDKRITETEYFEISGTEYVA